MLSRCINPQTGKIYTTDELSGIFKLRPRIVERKLRANGIFHKPLPIVRQGQLPYNERAFFTGLKLGKFQIEQIHWGRNDYVMVGTESERHFNFSMGRFEVEHRNGSGAELGVVTMKDPGRVLASLAELKSVCTLPFFRSLAQIN